MCVEGNIFGDCDVSNVKDNDIRDILDRALADSTGALNEYESKRVLAAFKIPVVREYLVDNANDAVVAAGQLGYPVVMKACAARLAHKTESGLVAMGIANADEAHEAFAELTKKAGGPIDGILVQPLVRGRRELLLGLSRAAGFGPCVTLGMGGVFAEVMRDVAIRAAPVTRADALDMIDQLRGAPALDAVRGMAPADRDAIADAIQGIARLGHEYSFIKEIDVNPIIIQDDGAPMAVDALVILNPDGGAA